MRGRVGVGIENNFPFPSQGKLRGENQIKHIQRGVLWKELPKCIYVCICTYVSMPQILILMMGTLT
jgi:hypothetical protein